VATTFKVLTVAGAFWNFIIRRVEDLGELMDANAEMNESGQ